MRKSIFLASMALLSISGNATALVADPLVFRPISVSGQPAGVAQILAIGPGLPPAKPLPPESCLIPGDSCPPPDSPFSDITAFGTCLYRLRWYPVGGNSFIPCDLSEIRTITSLGCYFDQTINYPTVVTAGPDALVPTPFCAGYDQYGVSHAKGDVMLLLGEIPSDAGTLIVPNLFGTVVFPTAFPFMQSIYM